MTRTRLERRNDFDEFYNSAKEIFTEFRNTDSRAEKFQNIYMLSICPGSRNGGTNNRVVEVFWGSRPFETITQGRNWEALTERGTTLLFERDDSGNVIISLFPAFTDSRKPIENSITLGIWLDPQKLKDKSFLKQCWSDFMAYMEYTSLDGNPSWSQKLRISYLRNFKNLVIDNKWTPTRFSNFSKEVLKYVLSVGLSGFIIYLVTLSPAKPSDNKTEQQLNEINKNLLNISAKLTSGPQSKKEMEKLSGITDSINLRTQKILKGIRTDKKNDK